MARPRAQIANVLDNDDQQTKLTGLAAHLPAIAPQNDAIDVQMDSQTDSDWSMFAGLDTYTLVDVIAAIVDRVVDAEADITDIQTALTSVLTAITAIQAVVEAHEARIAALEA